MEIEFNAATGAPDASTAIAFVAFHEGLEGRLPAVDAVSNGAAGRAVSLGRFKAAKGQLLDLAAPGEAARVLVAGAGASDGASMVEVEQAAAAVYAAVRASGLQTLTFDVDNLSAEEVAHAAFGVRLAAYRFDRYRTKEKAEQKTSISRVVFATPQSAQAQAAFAPLSALADGVCFTRDLVSEPANILHPEEFARRVKALEPLGLQVEVLGEAKMAELGMGALLCVGQGSRRESQLAVIQWKGAEDPDAQPIAFVGKGVCFDTGGISIKPADGMEDMKWDMGGAGVVAGLMHVLAARKAKVNVVGVLGLVENMPDGAAVRPGDIVTSMSGQTIEVINTDAEGRLVLADALWYCQDRFKPRFMVDLATLTGAIIISLGHDYAGLFSNDDALSEALLAASKASGEPLWRMPLPPQYEKQIDSMAADMKNVGGRPGGSITAALLLQRFVNATPWAHLDIAAVTWRKPSTQPTLPDGASGFGVRLLNQLVADRYEG